MTITSLARQRLEAPVSAPVDASPVARRLLPVALVLLAVGIAVAGIAWFTRSDNADAPWSTGTEPAAPSSSVSVGVAGVEVPISKSHGPGRLENGLASGFSQDEAGAALAAVHIMLRSGPTVGPEVFEPTITAQVAGANQAAMKLLVQEQYQELAASAGVEPGQPVLGNAEVLGYLVQSFASEGDSASVSVVLGSTDLAESGRAIAVDVPLQWVSGDWQVIAPPGGDWAATTSVLGGTPQGMLAYTDIG